MDNKYDVIIIGAGISGLVCGCYLAKLGKRVLILEQHSQVGGYCGSFRRGGFLFDIGVHYLGGLKRNGRLNRLLNDLNIGDEISFVRFDPSDTIIIPNHKVSFYSDFNKTIEELRKSFPRYKDKILEFYNLMSDKNFYSVYVKFKKKTFKNVLDAFFDNVEIKTIFSAVLGNVGLPPSKTPAVTALVLFQDFIFNSGYYPRGGMQLFPDTLLKAFLRFGGEINLKTKVNRINVGKSGKISGVSIEGAKHISSNTVVSCCDVKETVMDFLMGKKISCGMVKKVAKLKPSISSYALYLGVKEGCVKALKNHGTIWYMPTYDIEGIYNNIFEEKICKREKYFVAVFPSFHDAMLAPAGSASVELFIGAPFISEKFWNSNRKIMEENLIGRTKELIPDLSSNIVIKEDATPFTFYRYTANSKGALYGAASMSRQISRSYMPQRTNVANLYLAGHWTTSSGLGQGGVAGCIYSGQNVAKLVMKND